MSQVTPDSAETQRLLQRIRTGDRQAFEKLFARHRRYLRQVVDLRLDPKVRSRLDPCDVVQETHLEVFRRMPDYLKRRPMPFRLWLRKTAYERLVMVQRHHVQAGRRAVGREVVLPDRSSVQLFRQLLAPGLTPSQELARDERARRVRQAVAQLSEIDREILLMRNLEGLSNHEVAHVLEIEPAAASQRYARALLRLRKLLLAGGFSESGP
jgi:RNA polymerase sigma-70 factor, ECF subfamily